MDMFWIEFVDSNGRNNEVIVRGSNKVHAIKRFTKVFGKTIVIKVTKRMHYWEEEKNDIFRNIKVEKTT